MKVGTFFSGIGSPEQALLNLEIQHEIEFACDIDKYARETYLKNFDCKNMYNDITALDMKDLSYVDLLVFGFPCQAFSMAGKRGGFEDTRGTLFYDALRYLKEHKPRYFIAENVKGLLSHNSGRTFQTIIDCLASTINTQMTLMPFDNLGYHIHYKVLNTKDFGIPQNRERIFIVGIRDDSDNNFRFPKEIPLKLKLKDILQDNPNYAKSGLFQPYPRNYKELGLERKEQLEIRKDNVSNTITTSNDQVIKVNDKYYLSKKMVAGIFKSNFQKRKPMNIDKVSKCLKIGGDIPFFEVISHSLYPRTGDPKQGGTGHLSKTDGTSYCLDTGNAQAIELIRLNDVKLTATKRKNQTPKEINEFLKKHKNTTIKKIAKYLNIPKTQAEHYFRTDKSRCIPNVNDWEKLKTLLKFNDKYDNQVCEIEKKAYTFESSTRLYSENGLSATLQTTENTMYKSENKIRRLTPIECERLQGFPDNHTDGVSDTQRYRQCGNTITVNVIEAILKNLLNGYS